MSDAPTDEALLRIAAVCERTGLGKSTIYRLTSEGSFPVPVQITGTATGWVASEVAAWIRSRPRVGRLIPAGSDEG